MEETSIDLNQASFLGVLNPVQSLPRRDLRILPFVIRMEKEPKITLNRELEWYTWVNYAKIVQSKGKTVQPLFSEVSAFLLPNAVVWGITYKIINDLIRTVEGLKIK